MPPGGRLFRVSPLEPRQSVRLFSFACSVSKHGVRHAGQHWEDSARKLEPAHTLVLGVLESAWMDGAVAAFSGPGDLHEMAAAFFVAATATYATGKSAESESTCPPAAPGGFVRSGWWPAGGPARSGVGPGARDSMGPPAPVEGKARLVAWRINAVEIPMFGPVLSFVLVPPVQRRSDPRVVLGLVSSDTYSISGMAPALPNGLAWTNSEGTALTRESGRRDVPGRWYCGFPRSQILAEGVHLPTHPACQATRMS